MVLRTQNKNPYLIGGNPTGSAYAPVSYGDFVENTKTPVASTPSITYAEGTNNYGAGTGNYITPSQTVDTTYTQALGAVLPTLTPTQDSTPYNGGGGTIKFNTQTGEYAKVMPTAEPSVNPSESLPQYYESMRQQAIAQAEKDRLQANINAKGQYNEFINPYGVQAEQQARMGLTGGGYSEYLKGKAYEGMIDTQNQAQAQYAQAVQSAENTYNANMATYNEGLKAKEEAKAQDLAQGKVNMNAAMGGMVDGVDNTKWEDLADYGKQQGLTDEELNEYKGKWDFQQYLEGLDNSSDWNADKWQAFFDDARYETLSPDQKEAADKQFSATIANGLGINPETGATTSYFMGADGKHFNEGEAKTKYEEAQNNPHFIPELKAAIKKEYEERYRKGRTIEDSDIVKKAQGIQIPKGANVTIAEDAKVVDISKDTFQHSDFGKFNDTAKPGSGQYELIEAIINAARAGDIQNGEIVLVNYGRNNGGFKSVEAFMYVDGKFVQIEKGESVRIPKEMLYELDGYEYTGAGRTDDPTTFYDSIRKKKN